MEKLYQGKCSLGMLTEAKYPLAKVITIYCTLNNIAVSVDDFCIIRANICFHITKELVVSHTENR